MKKELITLGLMVCAALLIWLSSSVFVRISFRDVKEVRLYAYDHITRDETGLTQEEARQIVRLFNRSRHGGEVDAEPCCDSYGFTVDFTDGSTLYVGEGVKSKMIVRQGSRQPYYLENQALIDYILELVERYDLPRD